ncbi:ATP-binding protein [Eubacterium ruminantium]|uniref:ATP-binding protein n=1 Tax=Eubacterium ruminantium TaxID=42322 RepID=UPI0015685941|nr:ATP-binding protein [Eubacterium ruminantium]
MAEDRKNRKAPRRIAQVVLNSLKGGVVPRVGLPYVAVGRDKEIEAFLHDEEIIAEGGSSFRFIVGKYGSGKSFLLQTVRNYVLDKNFVVVDADLTPERRFQGTGGQGLATYRELLKNMSTRTKPEGGALSLILDKWISGVQLDVIKDNGLSPDDPELSGLTEKKIMEDIYSLNDMVHGFDFAKLIIFYYRAYVDGNDELKLKLIKWFRGEYMTKTDAKRELGVNIIISDDDWYDYLKLFALFMTKAGYSGLYIMIDELVNIFKITNSITRQNNYEKMLAMYNDCLQGKASHMGIIMCGTPECMQDTRRGVYSYEALRSRLSEGRFSGEYKDMLAPVISLKPLSYEEMYILIEKLSVLHSDLYDYQIRMSHEEMVGFLKFEFERIGAEKLITPREVIRDYIEILDIMYQEKDVTVSDIIGKGIIGMTAKASDEENDTEDEFAEFEI